MQGTGGWFSDTAKVKYAMSLRPCWKWSVQQLFLHNEAGSNKSFSSGALALHAPHRTGSTWRRQSTVRFLTWAFTTFLENKSGRWERAKTKTVCVQESCAWDRLMPAVGRRQISTGPDERFSLPVSRGLKEINAPGCSRGVRSLDPEASMVTVSPTFAPKWQRSVVYVYSLAAVERNSKFLVFFCLERKSPEGKANPVSEWWNSPRAGATSSSAGRDWDHGHIWPQRPWTHHHWSSDVSPSKVLERDDTADPPGSFFSCHSALVLLSEMPPTGPVADPCSTFDCGGGFLSPHERRGCCLGTRPTCRPH